MTVLGLEGGGDGILSLSRRKMGGKARFSGWLRLAGREEGALGVRERDVTGGVLFSFPFPLPWMTATATRTTPITTRSTATAPRRRGMGEEKGATTGGGGWKVCLDVLCGAAALLLLERIFQHQRRGTRSILHR